MNKIFVLILVLACGWLIWTLTNSVESSAGSRHDSTDEMSRELDPNSAPSNRRTAKDEAATKVKSWQRAIVKALPGTPATKKSILLGAGLLIGGALIWSALKKK
jgi:hypothetical protein